jgi:hypothetical protein
MLAEQSIKSTSDVDGRLTHAFRRVVNRPITPRDLSALRRAYDKQLAIYKADSAAATASLAIGAAKRDESLDATEHAALSAVCLAIMNLDEALTRE